MRGTNLAGVDPATSCKRYVPLTEAEWAFRVAKNELEIRPIRHQREERVRTHILVCLSAYVLWKTLAQWLRQAGLGDAPRALMEELAKIKSGDVARSRLEPIKKVARSIRTHEQLILNWFAARKDFSSGIVEGLNYRIKLTIRKAYGFRTLAAAEMTLYHALDCLPEPELAHEFC